MIGRNDPCWCGSQKKWKSCHFPQKVDGSESAVKDFAALHDTYLRRHHVLIKSPKDIIGIRRACQLASKILDKTCAQAVAGVTTQELNNFAHTLHVEAGAIPAPLRYGHPPFPRSICTSINEVICHGIPGPRPLKEGDIVNIDVTCILDGYYGDCSKMVKIGKVDKEKELVTNVSYECLMRSIEILKPGIPIYAIGDMIESCARANHCSVVYQFVGHGVGIEFHEGPQIPHNKNRNKLELIPGMTFTIEPMINAGVAEAIIDPFDKWTARTADGRASAQWEHTLLITDSGHEILTDWKREN